MNARRFRFLAGVITGVACAIAFRVARVMYVVSRHEHELVMLHYATDDDATVLHYGCRCGFVRERVFPGVLGDDHIVDWCKGSDIDVALWQFIHGKGDAVV